MSDLSKTVEIIFQGTDTLSGKLDKMPSKVDGFANDMQDIGQPFVDAALKVAELITAIGGIAAAGIKASSDLETEAKKMELSLGLPIEKAEEFEEIAKDVYTSGVTADLHEAFQTVASAQKKFGDDASVDIGKVSKAAAKVSDVFDKDIPGTMTTAKTLMDKFGLSVDDAFGFIISGFQSDLDSSGDLYDSINEYSTQFQDMGIDAKDAYSIIETGIQGGTTLGTDKVLDVFKEFRVKILENSDKVQIALTNIGIDPDQFKKDLDSGQLSFTEAFTKIQKALGDTETDREAFVNGVELMGTPFEDLGTKAVLEIDAIGDKVDDFQDKIEDFDDKTFKKRVIGSFRDIKTEFGDMEQWDAVKDQIADVFEGIAGSFGPALENADFSGLTDAVEEVWDDIADIFKNNDIDLTTVEGMENAIGIVVDSMESVFTVADGILEIIDPIVDAAIDVVEYLNDMEPGSKEIAGNLIGIGTAIGTLGGLVSVGSSLFGGLSKLAGMFGPKGALAKGLSSVTNQITGPAGFTSALNGLKTMGAIGISFTVGWEIGGVLRDTFNLDEPIQKAIRAVDKAINFTGTMGDVDLGFDKDQTEQELSDAFDSMDIDNFAFLLGVDTSEIDEVKGIIEEIPTEVKAKVGAALVDGDVDKAKKILDDFVNKDRKVELPVEMSDAEKVEKDLSDFFGEVDSYEKNLQIVAEMSADEDSITETQAKFEKVGERADGSPIMVEVPVESKDLDDVKKDIDEIPTEKQLEIKLQGEIDTKIAEIESKADTVQTAMEWKAKVDIAEAEAAADQVVSAFDASAKSIDSVSGSVSDMFSAFASNMDDLQLSDKWRMQDILEDQQDAQNNLIDAQVELTKAQEEYLEAKTEALKNGDGEIKIDGTGLSPALEMVMWEILEMVQVKATENQADFLLGI